MIMKRIVTLSLDAGTNNLASGKAYADANEEAGR